MALTNLFITILTAHQLIIIVKKASVVAEAVAHMLMFKAGTYYLFSVSVRMSLGGNLY